MPHSLHSLGAAPVIARVPRDAKPPSPCSHTTYRSTMPDPINETTAQTTTTTLCSLVSPTRRNGKSEGSVSTRSNNTNFSLMSGRKSHV